MPRHALRISLRLLTLVAALGIVSADSHATTPGGGRPATFQCQIAFECHSAGGVCGPDLLKRGCACYLPDGSVTGGC